MKANDKDDKFVEMTLSLQKVIDIVVPENIDECVVQSITITTYDNY